MLMLSVAAATVGFRLALFTLIQSRALRWGLSLLGIVTVSFTIVALGAPLDRAATGAVNQ